MLGMNKRTKKRRKNVRRKEDIKDGNHITMGIQKGRCSTPTTTDILS
jgi:hypothetical protein